MAWYIVCFVIGIIAGYIVKDLMPADIQYKGKFKQKGTNNIMSVDKPERVKKRRLKRSKKEQS